jgi:lipopolysaccharide transport system ATP-binding protein
VAEGLSRLVSPDSGKAFAEPVPLLGRLLRRREADTIEVDGADDDDDLDGDEEPDEPPERAPSAEDVAVWAIRDVSFTAGRGEAIAVVGPPGSGKTTLVRVLGGMYRPTRGRAELRGLVFPPIGFVESFVDAGRRPAPNVALASRLAGIPRGIATDRLGLIAEFAGRTLDSPIGKPSRVLALSVALNVDPDVLLLDAPALAGDAAFRARCLERLEQLVAQGCTVLLDAPDLTVVHRLCTRALWLDDGRLVADGPAAEVLDEHLAASEAGSTAFVRNAPAGQPPVQLRSFTDTISIRNAFVEDDAGAPVALAASGEPLTIRVRLETAAAAVPVRFGIALRAPDGGGAWVEQPRQEILPDPGLYDVAVRIAEVRLPRGQYAGHLEAITSGGRRIGLDHAFVLTLGGDAGVDEPGPVPSLDGSWRVTRPTDAV